jgi:glycosyltransferase involved in cell wall biosynthesis
MNKPSAQPGIVLFSTADWRTPYWTNKQHMAMRFAARGHKVLYIESVGLRLPRINRLDMARLARRLVSGLRAPAEMAESVWVVSPLTVPLGHGHPLVKRVNAFLLRRAVRRAIDRLGLERPIIWTYHPFMRAAIAGIARRALVYHCVDDLAATPFIDAVRFNAEEAGLLLEADAVFVTSPALRDKCAAVAPQATHYMPNVADIDHFAAARRPGRTASDIEAIPHPRLAFMGVLSDFKVDFALLEQIADTHPDWQLIIIGEEREGQHDPGLAALARRSNVHLLGYRPYSVLPDYLRGVDVGLLPLKLNDYTRAAFPMKFFEYLAAGLPVVSTPLPALAEFSGLHHAAPSGRNFILAIETVLSDRARFVMPLNDPRLQHNTWDRRLDRMLALLEDSSAKVHAVAADQR